MLLRFLARQPTTLSRFPRRKIRDLLTSLALSSAGCEASTNSVGELLWSLLWVSQPEARLPRPSTNEERCLRRRQDFLTIRGPGARDVDRDL